MSNAGAQGAAAGPRVIYGCWFATVSAAVGLPSAGLSAASAEAMESGK